jgi:hypothetical protein
MLVERKLKGVYSNVEIEVPFDAFDEYVDTMIEWLSEYEIEKTRLEVCENPLVIEAFENSLKDLVTDVDFSDLCDMIDEDTINFAFRPELDEIERLEAEQRAIEALRIEEERRIAEEAARAQREIDALTECQITVHKKHVNKAIALLQAAGLMKKSK